MKSSKYLSLSIELSDILKIAAVMIVVVSHWYRFYDTASHLSILKSTGVFGASLFAFLSGYGVEKSYCSKGIYRGVLLNRICKVYIPFLIVNIFSLFFYSSKNLFEALLQVTTGYKDGVMWYIPFVLAFYVMHYLTAKLLPERRIILLSIIGCIYIIVCIILKVPSQWYTSVGALLAGVFIADIKKPFRFSELFLVCMAFGVTAVLSKVFDNYILTDCLTLLSSTAFCYIVFLIFGLLKSDKKHKAIRILGNSTFWLYLTHMKILSIWNNPVVFLYVFLCIAVSVILCVVYSTVSKKLVNTFSGKRKTDIKKVASENNARNKLN